MPSAKYILSLFNKKNQEVFDAYQLFARLREQATILKDEYESAQRAEFLIKRQTTIDEMLSSLSSKEQEELRMLVAKRKS